MKRKTAVTVKQLARMGAAARNKSLTAAERTELARRAATARWKGGTTVQLNWREILDQMMDEEGDHGIEKMPLPIEGTANDDLRQCAKEANKWNIHLVQDPDDGSIWAVTLPFEIGKSRQLRELRKQKTK